MGSVASSPSPPLSGPAAAVLSPKTTQVVVVAEQRRQRVGLQVYLTLQEAVDAPATPDTAPWDRFRVVFYLDHHGLGRLFAPVTDRLWPSESVHLQRLALDAAINPTGVPLAFVLKGLFGAKGSGIVVGVPALGFSATDGSLPLLETAPPGRRCSFETLDLDVSWSHNPVAQQMIAQWMLDEERQLVCVSLMFDIQYTVAS